MTGISARTGAAKRSSADRLVRILVSNLPTDTAMTTPAKSPTSPAMSRRTDNDRGVLNPADSTRRGAALA
jgi:hypothetical protein